MVSVMLSVIVKRSGAVSAERFPLMKIRHAAGALALAMMLACPVYGPAAGKSSIVTFSEDDLSRAIGQCGCQMAPQGTKLHARRNTAGDLVYVISEHNKQEGIVTAESGTCNTLSKEVLDVFRNDKGEAVAQIIDKDNMRMLMVGDIDPVRGRRFDVERTGVYFVVSHGKDSVLAAIENSDRPELQDDDASGSTESDPAAERARS